MKPLPFCIRYAVRVVNKLRWPGSVKHDDEALSAPPLFIIGAPRSGSTALYQAITATLAVTYINNLSCALCNSLAFAFRVSRTIFRGKAHRCYQSKFGNTGECGWNAPAECGEFWYRWLPRDRHFVDFDDVSPRKIRQIRSEIAGATGIAGKPIVFKNLNAGQRLRLLSQAVPEARIIHITRDIRFNSQSIVTARRRNQIPTGAWWSIKPPHYEKYLDLSEAELSVAQVKAIDAQIVQDKRLFPSGQWKTIRYEDLTETPIQVLEDVAEFLNVKSRSKARIDEMVSAIKRPNVDKIHVEPELWEAICRATDAPILDQRVAVNTVYE